MHLKQNLQPPSDLTFAIVRYGSITGFHKHAVTIKAAPIKVFIPNSSPRNMLEKRAAKRGSKVYMMVISEAERVLTACCSIKDDQAVVIIPNK
jgi:hypothetical protein